MIRIVLGFIVPFKYIHEGISPRDVIYEEAARRVLVESSSDTLIGLASTCVPNLELDGEILDDDSLRNELRGRRWRQHRLEVGVDEPSQNAGLAHTFLSPPTVVPHHDVFEPVSVGHLWIEFLNWAKLKLDAISPNQK